MLELEKVFNSLTSSCERRVWVIAALLTFSLALTYYSVSYIKNYNVTAEWQQGQLRDKANGKYIEWGFIH
jgi:hypothetical protein